MMVKRSSAAARSKRRYKSEKGSAKAEPFGILSFADMSLAAEDHVVHVAMTDVIFFLHCTIPFSFSLTRLLYARANEKLYEKGQ